MINSSDLLSSVNSSLITGDFKASGRVSVGIHQLIEALTYFCNRGAIKFLRFPLLIFFSSAFNCLVSSDFRDSGRWSERGCISGYKDPYVFLDLRGKYSFMISFSHLLAFCSNCLVTSDFKASGRESERGCSSGYKDPQVFVELRD